MSAADPLGYYARLGVQPSAPASVIRAAYRVLAQEYHPDRNKSPDATRAFQDLQRAYEVLSDPRRRAEYDTMGAPPQQSANRSQARNNEAEEAPAKRGSEDYEPIRCSRCQAVSASPRYRVFYSVFGYLIGATRSPAQGIYCARCEMLVGLRCTGSTLLLGWWSIHGFFWSLDAVAKNIFGTREYLEQTARVLAHQTGYFLSVGNQRLAYAVALQALDAGNRVRRGRSAAAKKRAALGYDADDPISRNCEQLASFVKRAKDDGFAGPPLKETFGLHSPAFRAQGALIVTVAAVLAGWAWISHQAEVTAERERLYAAGVARAQAEAIARRQKEELARRLLPLPATGIMDGLNLKRAPPFRVTAPAGTHFYVKVSDWDSQETIATLFVRGGESAEITVPPGTYRIKMAAGQQWYGEDIRFGPDTAYSAVPEPLTFRIEGRGLLGHEINLNLVRHGNLRRQTITAGQF